MKKLLTILLTLFLFSSIANSKPAYTEYYPSGQINFINEYNGDLLHKETHYFRTGELKAVVSYLKGNALKQTVYRKTGEVKAVIDFSGEYKEKQTGFNKNGIKKYEIFYDIDGSVNLQLTYHQNGIVSINHGYRDGEQISQSRFNPNGVLESETKMVEGFKVNEVIFHKDGKTIKRSSSFVDGINNKEVNFTEDSKIISLVNIWDDRLVQSNYYPDGKIVKDQILIEDGMQTGQTFFDTLGVKIRSFTIDNKLITKQYDYYATGQISHVFDFGDGVTNEKMSNGSARAQKISLLRLSGLLEKVHEYVDGKPSKVTIYYKTGEVKSSNKWVDKLLNFSF